jgi:predicted nucleic acid-binding protein
VIHFDTNALVALPLWAQDDHPAVQSVLDGEPAAVCSLVWYEFLSGPVEESEADLARAFVADHILAIEDADATLAAKLFNATGRKRALKTDALIAACAIRADALFVTVNRSDFEPFVAHGLRVMPNVDVP